MAADITHGLIASANASAAVAQTTVGSIELPTRSGGWTIHNLMANISRQGATAAESVGGIFGIESSSGDIVPDPAPSQFPVNASGSFLGSVANQPPCPLHNYPMDLAAAGKANLDLVYSQAIALTTAPGVNIGIAFGPNIPQKRPFKFCSRVRSTIAAAANTQVGTINISEKATRITGIMGVLLKNGIVVTAQQLSGIFSLRSDDVDLVPSYWLFNEVYGAGLSTTINSPMATMPQPHIVDIPVPGGARIDCYVDLISLITNAADVEIFLFYE